MQIDIIDSYKAFAELETNWNAVYQKDPEAQFFLSWTWFSKVFLDHPKQCRIWRWGRINRMLTTSASSLSESIQNGVRADASFAMRYKWEEPYIGGNITALFVIPNTNSK